MRPAIQPMPECLLPGMLCLGIETVFDGSSELRKLAAWRYSAHTKNPGIVVTLGAILADEQAEIAIEAASPDVYAKVRIVLACANPSAVSPYRISRLAARVLEGVEIVPLETAFPPIRRAELARRYTLKGLAIGKLARKAASPSGGLSRLPSSVSCAGAGCG